MRWSEKWKDQISNGFYDRLLAEGLLREEDEDNYEPEIGPFIWYMDAFREINTCRSTVALAPIPFTAIAEYCRLYNIEDSEEFLYIMRRLDDEYLKVNKKEAKSDGKN